MDSGLSIRVKWASFIKKNFNPSDTSPARNVTEQTESPFKENFSYTPINLDEQASEIFLESTTEQTKQKPLNENKKHVSIRYYLHLYEKSSKKQKICLLAIVVLILTVICAGIGVSLSYYNDKSQTSEYMDHRGRNSGRVPCLAS